MPGSRSALEFFDPDFVIFALWPVIILALCFVILRERYACGALPQRRKDFGDYSGHERQRLC